MKVCTQCKKPVERYVNKYCSNRCQIDYQYQQYILAWKRGEKNGERGINARTVSKHLVRFLAEKYGEKCSQCGWSEKHSYTHRVPLEIDHIDGNAYNNREGNLRLICPNCHSLTANFRNLNKGKGRDWRIGYLKKRKTEKIMPE